MQVALGRSVADEMRSGIHKVSKLLLGDSGLSFISLPKEDVQRLFHEYEDYDFARTGSTATETVELNEGPLDQFTHEMEPFLRKQGMPVRLNKGVVELVSDFVVCEEGKLLSPSQLALNYLHIMKRCVTLLYGSLVPQRLLRIKMATFKLHLICRWSSEDFEVYKEGLEDSDVESS